MDDEQILERGGTQRDIEEYAKQNGADLTEADFESSKEEPIKEVEDKARREGRKELVKEIRNSSRKEI